MSIVATCECGAEFKAKPELAGKRVKCPKCEQHFVVPKPQSATSPILVNCQCGKVLQAKPDLAGKRVKCPGCGQPLVIATPNVEVNPLEADRADDDPLGLGDLGDDPLGLGADVGVDPLGSSTLPQMPKAATLPAHVPTRRKRAKSTESQLMTVAGWVAVCFGGYQVLVSSWTVLRLLFFVLRSGSPMPLISIGFVASLLFLGLGIWLGKSGIDIIREVTPSESLERAAQASMVYIVLFILRLLGGMYTLFMVGQLGLGATGGLFIVVVLLSLVLPAIYIIPPAFIYYVSHRLSREVSLSLSPSVPGVVAIMTDGSR